jgi:hypothetical protein
MYAVVGCSDCQALWIVEGQPERSTCPRCQSTSKFTKRRKFVTTEDEDAAREARASLLAKRGGYEDEFASLDSFAELDAVAEEAGIDDETYLEASGIDSADVAAAGEPSSATNRSQSREATLREALRELDNPTERDIIAYTGDRGVSKEYTETALAKLVRSGEVSENRGTYRLL